MRQRLKKLIISILFIPLILSSCTFSFPLKSRLVDESVTLPTVYDYNIITEENDNDSVFEGSGFYFNQLSADEKNVYSKIYNGSVNYESEITLDYISQETFYKTIYAVSYDNPDLFWINTNFTATTMNGYVTSVRFPMPDNAYEISRQLEDTADEIISGIPDDYDLYMKLKYIYEWIIDNVEYRSGEQDQDIRSVFFERRSVCAGYSRAFEYLCNKIGIPCTFVSGEAKGNSHAWNLIYLDNDYYWVDVTWGDPVYLSDSTSYNEPYYNYFCVTDSEIFKTHSISKTIETENNTYEIKFDYPECINDYFNYYKIIGSYFEYYSRDELDAYLYSKLSTVEGRILIDIKYKDEDSFYEAYYDIISEDGYSHIADFIKEYYNSTSWFNVISYSTAVSYNTDTLTYRIIINEYS